MSLSHKCLSSVCQIQLPWSFDFFSLSQKQINGSSDSHYLFCLCSQPRHHSWQFRRWNREGSCLSEFFCLLLVIFTLELGNKTIAIPRVFFLLSKWKSFMLDDLCEEITNKCKFLRMVMLTKFIGGFTLFWLFVLKYSPKKRYWHLRTSLLLYTGIPDIVFVYLSIHHFETKQTIVNFIFRQIYQ